MENDGPYLGETIKYCSFLLQPDEEFLTDLIATFQAISVTTGRIHRLPNYGAKWLYPCPVIVYS